MLGQVGAVESHRAGQGEERTEQERLGSAGRAWQKEVRPADLRNQACKTMRGALANFNPPPSVKRPCNARAVGSGPKGESLGEACRPRLALKPLFSSIPPRKERPGKARTREQGTYLKQSR